MNKNHNTKVRNHLNRSKAASLLKLVNALMMVGSVSAQSTNSPATSGSDKSPKPVQKPVQAELDEVVVTAKEDPNSYQPTKVSSSKYTESLRDTPQTVTVIPQSVIKDQGTSTLRDVLRNVPGISVQAGEGGVPAGDQLSVRGFSARTDMFVDGVRDIGGYTRDPFNLEQVEVSKGPASAYTGRGSTGGSINMVSKAPKLENFYDGDVAYGTNEYYRTTVDLNQKIPMTLIGSETPAALRVNGLFHSQDYSGRDYVSDERWAVAPSLAFGLETPTRVTFSSLHLEEKNLPSYGLPFVATTANAAVYGGGDALGRVAPVPYSTFFGLANRDYEDISNDIYGMKLEHDFTDNVKLENQTRYGRTYRDSVISAPRFQANTVAANGARPIGVNRQIQSRDQIDQVIANQTNLLTEFETWKVPHSMVSSIEYSYESEINYARSAPTLFRSGTTNFQALLGDAYSPNPYDTSTGPVSRTGANNRAISDSVGVSVFDTIKLTEQWILTLGARGDYFETHYDQVAANTSMTKFERADLEPTWKTGLTYKPVPYGSIYFGYGTSFNPSAEGLTLATTTVALEPETSESFELGTKWDLLDEKLSLSGALFRTIKSNFRTTDPVTAEVSTTGEVQVEGIELGVAGSLSKAWKAFGGYTIMDSEITKSKTVTTYNGVAGIREEGRTLSNTPQQTASIWTTYMLPFHLEIGTGVQFIDKRYANNINTNSVDGYWLQDLLFSYKVNDHMDVRFNIQNLWDTEYIDRVGGGHAIPGTGRMMILSSSIKF